MVLTKASLFVAILFLGINDGFSVELKDESVTIHKIDRGIRAFDTIAAFVSDPHPVAEGDPIELECWGHEFFYGEDITFQFLHEDGRYEKIDATKATDKCMYEENAWQPPIINCYRASPVVTKDIIGVLCILPGNDRYPDPQIDGHPIRVIPKRGKLL